jgi:sugar phosphate isomerase/epimerase
LQLGIFTQYLPYGVEETARRARQAGFDTVQLNLSFPDWTFATNRSAQSCRCIRDAFTRAGLRIAAISGYVNPVAPDPARRDKNVGFLKAVLDRALALGSPYVVTETGTQHPEDDWAPHPQNDNPATYGLLVETVADLARHARESGATLLLEPSVGNVIDTPEKMLRLLRDLDSPAVGIVIDPANYIDGANLHAAEAILEQSFALLGPHIRLAHAKDFRRFDGVARERHHHATDPALYGGVEYPAAGLGDLDHDRYLALLQQDHAEVPIILEHLDEADIARARSFLMQKLQRSR